MTGREDGVGWGKTPITEPQAKREPIMVDCEGSGYELRLPGILGGICQMCGSWFPAQDGGLAPKHRRQDVLAMVERGDFG